MFDSSLTLVEAAARGVGVALVPVAMFSHDVEAGRIMQPFQITAMTGSYWLTRLKSRAETASMKVFRQWLLAEIENMPG
jgi:LysR family transcriptional regulator of beta-lactamase